MILQHGPIQKIEGYEKFGLDYAETLRRWRRKFEQNIVEIKQLGFDEQFIRLWRFYLTYCEVGFDERHIDVVHLKLTR